MIESIIKPKKPTGDGWQQILEWAPPRLLAEMGYQSEAWEHDSGLFAISAVEVAEEPGKMPLGPEYHLSISKDGHGRCDRNEARFVLRAFGLEDAKEDNHVPGGFVRNYWRPVADSLSGYECECVDDEPAIKENKGDFVWRGVTK